MLLSHPNTSEIGIKEANLDSSLGMATPLPKVSWICMIFFGRPQKKAISERENDDKPWSSIGLGYTPWQLTTTIENHHAING